MSRERFGTHSACRQSWTDQVEQAHARRSHSRAATLDALDALRVSLLGKSGLVTEQLKALGKLPAEERKAHGEQRQSRQGAAAAKRSLRGETCSNRPRCSSAWPASASTSPCPAAMRDRGSLHPLTRALDRIIDIFARLGYEVADGPEIEDDWHNFGALNFPPRSSGADDARHVLVSPTAACCARIPRRCRSAR